MWASLNTLLLAQALSYTDLKQRTPATYPRVTKPHKIYPPGPTCKGGFGQSQVTSTAIRLITGWKCIFSLSRYANGANVALQGRS